MAGAHWLRDQLYEAGAHSRNGSGQGYRLVAQGHEQVARAHAHRADSYIGESKRSRDAGDYEQAATQEQAAREERRLAQAGYEAAARAWMRALGSPEHVTDDIARSAEFKSAEDDWRQAMRQLAE